MKKLPITRNQPATRDEEREVEVMQPRFGEWWAFSYTHTEITVIGAKTKVSSSRARYAGGRLMRDSFEGELDRGAGERLILQAQDAFLEQAALAMRAFGAAFLTGGPRRRRRGD